MDKVRGFEKVSFDQWDSDNPCRKPGCDLGGGRNCDCSYYDYDLIKLPVRSTKKSGGYDIFSPVDFILYPGQEIKIPLGIKVYIQDGEFLSVLPRSGQGFKYYVRLANTQGVIDSDYYNNPKNEGHMWLKIRNESTPNLDNLDTLKNQILVVNAGDAICQGIFQNFLLADGDSFDNGNERSGGFGSTDKVTTVYNITNIVSES